MRVKLITILTLAVIASVFLAQPFSADVYAATSEQQCDSLHEDVLNPDFRLTDEYKACIASISNPSSGCITGSEEACFTVYAEDGFAENPIYTRVNDVINFLSVGIGILITISVVVASLQWTLSGGEPQAKAAAVARLWNSGVALVLFAFAWVIINWLVPGGVDILGS